MQQLGAKKPPLNDEHFTKFDTSVSKTFDLGHGARIMFIPKGVKKFANPDILLTEMMGVKHDKIAFMRGRVVNKLARRNYNVADLSQDPDYESGKGTVHSFDDLPELTKIRKEICGLLPEKGLLLAEAYVYYGKNTGIGYHGDSERTL
jgi:hypothetical protein